MAVDEKTLTKTLRELGRSRDGARRKLIQDGAYGEPSDSQSCSIAEWLKARFPGERVGVASTIMVNGAEVNTPSHLASFIEAFDDGEIPELIEHTRACYGVIREREYPDDDYFQGDHIVRCACGRLYRAFSHYDNAASVAAFVRRAKRGKFPAASA